MGFAPLGVRVSDSVCDLFHHNLQLIVRHQAEGAVIVSTAWFTRVEQKV